MLVTAEEYTALRKAHQHRKEEEYEKARWICFNILHSQPFLKRDRLPRTVRDYIRFPWEPEPEVLISKVSEATNSQLIEIFKNCIDRKEQS